MFVKGMKITLIITFLAIVALAYWKFATKSKTAKVDPNELRYSQLDITEYFGDQSRFTKEEWIATVALNSKMRDPVARGLPPHSATSTEIYTAAAQLSVIRSRFAGLGDGVYCPVCHIANVDYEKLNTPCPKCGRKLLSFGWD